MARSFRESYASMSGSVRGAILDELMNEVAQEPESWPFIHEGCLRAACSPGHTSPMFMILYGMTDSTIVFAEVKVSEILGAWGIENAAGETSH